MVCHCWDETHQAKIHLLEVSSLLPMFFRASRISTSVELPESMIILLTSNTSISIVTTNTSSWWQVTCSSSSSEKKMATPSSTLSHFPALAVPEIWVAYISLALLVYTLEAKPPLITLSILFFALVSSWLLSRALGGHLTFSCWRTWASPSLGHKVLQQSLLDQDFDVSFQNFTIIHDMAFAMVISTIM